MDDQELLFNAIKFCIAHTKRCGDCKKDCPLSNTICIDKEGDIRLSGDDNSMNFVKFTEEFRYMVKIIAEWTNKSGT